MISEAKANRDGVKIRQGPHPYKAQDVQNKPLDVSGYTEYFLINEKIFVRRIEVAVVRQGGDDDVLINLDTLMQLGIVKYNFPTIDNDVFEKDASKLEKFEECDDTDQWGFSNAYIRKVS